MSRNSYASLLFDKFFFVSFSGKHYKEKPFPCDQCDKKFFTITDAQKHIKIVHLNEKPFACEKCGKQYSTSGGLLIHNRSAHGDKGEWLQCAQCDKKFAYKQILQAHILNNHDKVCSIINITE